MGVDMNGDKEHFYTVEIYEHDQEDEDVLIKGWIVQANDRWRAYRRAKIRAGDMYAGPRVKQNPHVSTAEEIKNSTLAKDYGDYVALTD